MSRFVDLPACDQVVRYLGSHNADQRAQFHIALPDITKDLHIHDAIPISMGVQCRSFGLPEYKTARNPKRNDLRPLTDLWMSHIQLYTPFPTGYHYYVAHILREDPAVPRHDLHQLFGRDHHPLEPVLMFCEAIGSTDRKSVACSYVAMVCLMFYLMVNERWMQYTPPPDKPYSEAYPPHVFLLYYPRDFAFAAKNAAVTAFESWEQTARSVPLAEFVYRVFQRVFATRRAFESIDTRSFVDNNLKKNWALFLSSRQFGELAICNFKDICTELLRELYPDRIIASSSSSSSSSSQKQLIHEEVITWYPQQPFKYMKLRAPRHSQFLPLLRLSYHNWFTPLHSLLSGVPPAPATLSHAYVIAHTPHLLWHLLWLLPNSDRQKLRTDVNKHLNKNAKSADASIATKALELRKMNRNEDNSYCPGFFELDFVRLRYSFFIQPGILYYFPPWHCLSSKPPIDEASLNYLPPYKIAILLQRSRNLLPVFMGTAPVTDASLTRFTLDTISHGGGSPWIQCLGMLIRQGDHVPDYPYRLYLVLREAMTDEADALRSVGELLRIANKPVELYYTLLKSRMNFEADMEHALTQARQYFPGDLNTILHTKTRSWNGSEAVQLEESELLVNGMVEYLIDNLEISLVPVMAQEIPSSPSLPIGAAVPAICIESQVCCPAPVVETIRQYIASNGKSELQPASLSFVLAGQQLSFRDAARKLQYVFRHRFYWPVAYFLSCRCPGLCVKLPHGVPWHQGKPKIPPNSAFQQLRHQVTTLLTKVLSRPAVCNELVRSIEHGSLNEEDKQDASALVSLIPVTPHSDAVIQKIRKVVGNDVKSQPPPLPPPPSPAPQQIKLESPSTLAQIEHMATFLVEEAKMLSPEFLSDCIMRIGADSAFDSRKLKLVDLLQGLLERVAKRSPGNKVVIQSCAKEYATSHVYRLLIHHSPFSELYDEVPRELNRGRIAGVMRRKR